MDYSTNGVCYEGLRPETDMQSNFASWCPTAQQTALNASYVQGFKDGLKGRSANAIEDNAVLNSSNNNNNNNNNSWF